MNTQPDLLPASTAALIRQGLTFIGGILVARGVVDESAVPELVGAALSVISFSWSVLQKRKALKALKAAIAAPAGLAQ